MNADDRDSLNVVTVLVNQALAEVNGRALPSAAEEKLKRDLQAIPARYEVCLEDTRRIVTKARRSQKRGARA